MQQLFHICPDEYIEALRRALSKAPLFSYGLVSYRGFKLVDMEKSVNDSLFAELYPLGDQKKIFLSGYPIETSYESQSEFRQKNRDLVEASVGCIFDGNLMQSSWTGDVKSSMVGPTIKGIKSELDSILIPGGYWASPSGSRSKNSNYRTSQKVRDLESEGCVLRQLAGNVFFKPT